MNDHKMQIKGYCFKLTPINRYFEPLYVKTLADCGKLMRVIYPEIRFKVEPLGSQRVTLTAEHIKTFQATYFRSNGKKAETWLPLGEYQVQGEVWLDTQANIRAICLYHIAQHTTYYVQTDILEKLC